MTCSTIQAILACSDFSNHQYNNKATLPGFAFVLISFTSLAIALTAPPDLTFFGFKLILHMLFRFGSYNSPICCSCNFSCSCFANMISLHSSSLDCFKSRGFHYRASSLSASPSQYFLLYHLYVFLAIFRTSFKGFPLFLAIVFFTWAIHLFTISSWMTSLQVF